MTDIQNKRDAEAAVFGNGGSLVEFVQSNLKASWSPVMTREEFSDYVAWALNPAGMTFERLAAFQHQAAWTDVAAKAKRLVQSGQVTILRNAPHHIMAHVIGDHGEYDCEITRNDPSSQIIEQWNCECPWSQYAFDRTRKWKKLEGRVCSHVLATYWKARSTPLDMQDVEPGTPVPAGQVPGAAPGQAQMPLPPMAPMPHDIGQPPPPAVAPPPSGPTKQDITFGQQPQPNVNAPVIPKPPQHEQLQLFDITAPPGQQPVPGATPVSIPGGRPPTPGNPVQFPGTFSHFIPFLTIYSDFIYTADELTNYFEQQRGLMQPIYVKLKTIVALELTGGKIPVPGAKPYDISVEGVPLYNVMQLGYNPQTGMRENADVNELSGAPEQRGVYVDIQANKRAEVLDYDPNMRMAYIFVPLNYPGGEDIRLHPHGAKGWVDYSDIAIDQGSNPFRA